MVMGILFAFVLFYGVGLAGVIAITHVLFGRHATATVFGATVAMTLSFPVGIVAAIWYFLSTKGLLHVSRLDRTPLLPPLTLLERTTIFMEDYGVSYFLVWLIPVVITAAVITLCDRQTSIAKAFLLVGILHAILVSVAALAMAQGVIVVGVGNMILFPSCMGVPLCAATLPCWLLFARRTPSESPVPDRISTEKEYPL